MSKLLFLGSCASSAHIALLIYSLVAMVQDFILSVMAFVTGIVSILLFSMARETYESKNVFTILMPVGITTFNASIYLSQLYPVFSAIFKWAIAVAFNFGSLRSMRLVEGSEIAKRNIVYLTLTLILNIIYALMTNV